MPRPLLSNGSFDPGYHKQKDLVAVPVLNTWPYAQPKVETYARYPCNLLPNMCKLSTQSASPTVRQHQRGQDRHCRRDRDPSP